MSIASGNINESLFPSSAKCEFVITAKYNRDCSAAQTYFAVQTRKQEIIEKRLLDVARVTAREKLSP